MLGRPGDRSEMVAVAVVVDLAIDRPRQAGGLRIHAMSGEVERPPLPRMASVRHDPRKQVERSGSTIVKKLSAPSWMTVHCT
jgi:hypothetical protein